ncbi:ABC transporter permease [Actinoplanes sp. GCM10030250]|uniref:ABC transporter permease n=1 Tax=Actinoplanes sp. GCM10030250 TaxID=3273376 RepID=UPI003607CE2C
MRDVIAAEWLKTRSLRSTWWALGLTAAVVIGSAATSAQMKQTSEGFAVGDAFPLAGYLALVVVATSFGATVMLGEYSSGLIRATTVAVPARAEVVLAKAVVVAALWTVVGGLTALGSYAVARLLLPGSADGPATVTAVLGATLLGPACALIGLGLAVLLRHGGVVHVSGILLLVLVPQLFSSREELPRAINHAMIVPGWQRLTLGYGSPEAVGVLYTSVTAAWLAYALWPLIVVAVALAVHRRRDI